MPKNGTFNMNTRLMIDFGALCREYGIKVAQVGEKHYRNGWICLPCPFCKGDAGNHLGFNPNSNVFTCWRCGRHSKFEVLSALLGMSKSEAYKLCEERFGGGMALSAVQVKQAPIEHKSFKLPGGKEIPKLHREYFEGRKLDVDKMQARYGLRFCGPYGRYKYRVIIPVKHKGRIVSFTSRDVTGKCAARYLSCPTNEERKSIKDCLLGDDIADDMGLDDVIVVEGPFDAMKMGIGAVAVMGIEFSEKQVRKIARFKRSWLLFDPNERPAMIAQEKLFALLGTYPRHTCTILDLGDTEKDPGELSHSDVRKVWKYVSEQNAIKAHKGGY